MGFFKKLKFWGKKNKGADLKKRVEELEKKNAELQDKLEENDREWEQVVAILRGQICEPEEMIAARDGEMDANEQTGEMDTNQQTVQVLVEGNKGKEQFLQETIEEEIVVSTLQPAGSFAESTPQRERDFDSARQQEKQTEVEFTMKKLKEDKDLEIHEIRPRVDKTVVMEHFRELQDFVLYLKQTVTNFESDRGERIEIQKKQEEELQELRVKYNELQNVHKKVVYFAVDIICELEQLKSISDRLDEEWKLEMKNINDKKEILVMRIKELQNKSNEPVEPKHVVE